MHESTEGIGRDQSETEIFGDEEKYIGYTVRQTFKYLVPRYKVKQGNVSGFWKSM